MCYREEERELTTGEILAAIKPELRGREFTAQEAMETWMLARKRLGLPDLVPKSQMTRALHHAAIKDREEPPAVWKGDGRYSFKPLDWCLKNWEPETDFLKFARKQLLLAWERGDAMEVRDEAPPGYVDPTFCVRVTEEVAKQVRSGELNGFSLGGRVLRDEVPDGGSLRGEDGGAGARGDLEDGEEVSGGSGAGPAADRAPGEVSEVPGAPEKEEPRAKHNLRSQDPDRQGFYAKGQDTPGLSNIGGGRGGRNLPNAMPPGSLEEAQEFIDRERLDLEDRGWASAPSAEKLRAELRPDEDEYCESGPPPSPSRGEEALFSERDIRAAGNLVEGAAHGGVTDRLVAQLVEGERGDWSGLTLLEALDLLRDREEETERLDERWRALRGKVEETARSVGLRFRSRLDAALSELDAAEGKHLIRSADLQEGTANALMRLDEGRRAYAIFDALRSVLVWMDGVPRELTTEAAEEYERRREERVRSLAPKSKRGEPLSEEEFSFLQEGNLDWKSERPG